MSLPTSLVNLQAAFYTAMTAASTFKDACPRVYDAVPETPAHPYALIGDASESSDRTMGQNGHEVFALVSLVTRDGSTAKPGSGSRGFKESLTLANLLVDRIVENNALSVSGSTVVFVEVDSIETVREDDGVTRTTEVRFRLMLEDDI